MTNIRCKRNKEIDLLAIHPKTDEKYHVESRIGTSPSFKIRLHDTYTKSGRAYRIGLDYFAKEKFDHPLVKEKIKEIFGDVDYNKWLVVWNVQDVDVIKQAKVKFGIRITSIGLLLSRMVEKGQVKGSRDDILRVIELMTLSRKRKDVENMRKYIIGNFKERIKKSGLSKATRSQLIEYFEKEYMFG